MWFGLALFGFVRFSFGVVCVCVLASFSFSVDFRLICSLDWHMRVSVLGWFMLFSIGLVVILFGLV